MRWTVKAVMKLGMATPNVRKAWNHFQLASMLGSAY